MFFKNSVGRVDSLFSAPGVPPRRAGRRRPAARVVPRPRSERRPEARGRGREQRARVGARGSASYV